MTEYTQWTEHIYYATSCYNLSNADQDKFGLSRIIILTSDNR
jgi:hypothetical protein